MFDEALAFTVSFALLVHCNRNDLADANSFVYVCDSAPSNR